MNILEKDYNTLSWDKKRIWIKEYYNNTCQKCGNKEWLGEQIPLEINHINGNNKEHEFSNVELLCCNCHALTDNWRGRNKVKREFITDKGLLELIIKNEFNIRQSLIEAGLSPKGGNYKRCKDLIQKYKNKEEIFENKKLRNKPIFKEKLEELILKNYNKSDIREYYDGISSGFLDKKLKEFNLSNLYYKHNNKRPNNLKEVLDNIKKSKIDFQKRGWAVKLSKEVNRTPSYCLRLVKTKLPELLKINTLEALN